MTTKLSELFITGCDKNTRWMLPWFYKNFQTHNPTANLHVFDFDKGNGWFQKPQAMSDAVKMAHKVCWLDTDCEVRADLSGIFDLLDDNKLSMVEDEPWSVRRHQRWHNSGVVAFKGSPSILSYWAREANMLIEDRGPMYGDQDILHELVREGLNREIHIRTLPKTWNTLRLDLLDNKAPKDIKIMHWTGAKGKDEIRRQIDE